MLDMNVRCRGLAATVIAASLLPLVAALAAEHQIRPGDPPQPILDRAALGDRLVFLPGVHQHGLARHRAMLSVEKPIEIELRTTSETMMR